jgi:hypothetical protein
MMAAASFVRAASCLQGDIDSFIAQLRAHSWLWILYTGIVLRLLSLGDLICPDIGQLMTTANSL